MLKNSLLILAVFGSLKTIAQPALTTAYFPQIGKTLTGKTFKKGIALPTISEGMNQTWNFSGLDSVYVQDFNFLVKAKTVASTDSGIKFSDAQSANISFFGGDSVQNYFKTSATDLQFIGYSLKGLADKEKFITPKVEFRAGLGFEDTYRNQSRCKKEFYGDVIYKVYRDTISYVGSGTLITPSGTYNNVVLLTNRFSIDFNYSGNPNGSYEIGYLGQHWLWYLPGYGVPFMKYSQEIDWSDRTLVFYEGYIGSPQNPTFAKNYLSNSIKIFPSVVEKNEMIRISEAENSQKTFVKIFDLHSKLVQNQEVVNNIFTISNLQPGIYFVVLNNEKRLSRHKILVR